MRELVLAAFFMVTSSWLSANASVITLHCEGVTRGPDILDSPSTKVIEVDTVTKRILSISPAPTACFLGKLRSKNTRLYDDTTDFSCISDVAESYLKLSRYDFKLEEITRWTKKDKKETFWMGNFSCSQKERKF